jgi:hypothetical protein
VKRIEHPRWEIFFKRSDISDPQPVGSSRGD